MNLFEIKPGQTCIIDRINLSGSMRRRLLDLGLIPDTKVECVGISPLGDPKAFLIRGGIYALRKKDCQNIFVKQVFS